MSNQFIILILVFSAVFFAAWSIRNMLSESEKETSSQYPFLFRVLGPGIFFFSAEAGSLLENTFPDYSRKMREDLKKAALPLEVKDLYGAALLFAILSGVLGTMVVFSVSLSTTMRVLLIIIFSVTGGVYPHIYVQKMAEKRMDEILHSLPFAIDLISSSMNAGLDFGAAVRYLISTGKEDVLKKEFSVFLNDVELGKTRTDALKDMQERINAVEFTRFISAISYGMDSGSSIIDIMRIQAEEMRRVKYARAEQQAAKAPVKMIVPMAIFVFPSMFIMIFVPIFLRIKDSGILHMIGK